MELHLIREIFSQVAVMEEHKENYKLVDYFNIQLYVPKFVSVLVTDQHGVILGAASDVFRLENWAYNAPVRKGEPPYTVSMSSWDAPVNAAMVRIAVVKPIAADQVILSKVFLG